MKGLIIAPGLVNYLAINCLRKEKPDVVAFIVTEKTVELIPEILKNTGATPEYKKFFVKDVSSFGESVQEFLNAFYWLTDMKHVRDVAVDATNALKTVGFPVYFVASFIEVFRKLINEDVAIRLIFTACDWKTTQEGTYGSGEPILGTERIIELEHPTNTIGFILGAIACDLFNRGFYPRAEKTFEILAENTRGEQNLLYQSLTVLARAYDLWDKFNIPEAHRTLQEAQRLLKKAEKFNFARSVQKVVDANLDALSATEKGNPLEKIVDIFENANRKMSAERFDDAVSRYYRCLDMIAQYALEKRNISTQKPDFAKLPPETVEAYRQARGGSLPQEYKDGTGGIALKDAFLLLACMGDPLGEKYRKIEPKFLGFLTMRNQSILAHGLNAINKEKAEKFRQETTLPFLCKLLEQEGLNLETMLKRHQYPQLAGNIKNLYLDLDTTS